MRRWCLPPPICCTGRPNKMSQPSTDAHGCIRICMSGPAAGTSCSSSQPRGDASSAPNADECVFRHTRGPLPSSLSVKQKRMCIVHCAGRPQNSTPTSRRSKDAACHTAQHPLGTAGTCCGLSWQGLHSGRVAQQQFAGLCATPPAYKLDGRALPCSHQPKRVAAPSTAALPLAWSKARVQGWQMRGQLMPQVQQPSQLKPSAESWFERAHQLICWCP
jgi:hypothetical protein